MGADNSANTCRRITETVRDAGINGITLPRDEVVILTINRQGNDSNLLIVFYVQRAFTDKQQIKRKAQSFD